MEAFDIITTLLGFINVRAAMLGVAATQAASWALPPKEGEHALSTKAGHWGSRLLPAVSPIVACAATVFLEWDGAFSDTDAVRGILSGFASEYFLRVYYKTIKGL